MIYADPWDEALRLESLLESELLGSAQRPASRIPDQAFDGLGPSNTAPTPRHRFDPEHGRRSTLGFLYTGHPYKVGRN